MITVKELLDEKNQSFVSFQPSDNILLPLELMRKHKVRSILVIEDMQLKGIITQGDCAIRVLLARLDPEHTTVESVMTAHPLAVDESYDLDQCMGIMSGKRLRHLPVLRNSEVVGVVSIGDLVNRLVEDQSSRIASLENYIIGHGITY